MIKFEFIETAPTKKNKLKHIQFLTDQLNEMKDLIIADKTMKDSQKQIFMRMYLMSLFHINILHYYIKCSTVWGIFIDLFRLKKERYKIIRKK